MQDISHSRIPTVRYDSDMSALKRLIEAHVHRGMSYMPSLLQPLNCLAGVFVTCCHSADLLLTTLTRLSDTHVSCKAAKAY